MISFLLDQVGDSTWRIKFDLDSERGESMIYVESVDDALAIIYILRFWRNRLSPVQVHKSGPATIADAMNSGFNSRDGGQ